MCVCCVRLGLLNLRRGRLTTVRIASKVVQHFVTHTHTHGFLGKTNFVLCNTEICVRASDRTTRCLAINKKTSYRPDSFRCAIRAQFIQSNREISWTLHSLSTFKPNFMNAAKRSVTSTVFGLFVASGFAVYVFHVLYAMYVCWTRQYALDIAQHPA